MPLPTAALTLFLPFTRGRFQPPGSYEVADFVSEYDMINDPRLQAFQASERHAQKEAEKARRDAERAMAGEVSPPLELPEQLR